jgi:hypothetical protein
VRAANRLCDATAVRVDRLKLRVSAKRDEIFNTFGFHADGGGKLCEERTACTVKSNNGPALDVESYFDS